MSSPIEPLDLSDAATAAEVLEVQRAASLEETLEELRAAALRWWGVREGGRVVATIAVAEGRRQWSIDRLMVAPSHHRRGFGRRLVEHVLATSPAEFIEVSTLTENEPARRLYEALGFKMTGVREVAPGVTVTRYDRWHPKFATSFDADVANYEASRPGYPSSLYERLAGVGLVPSARVLEIGPGPGPVTAELLALGAQVVAVEPGAAMAARLRERFADEDCEVVQAPFESAALTGPFDLAVSGTALHWVDLTVGLPRLASLLAPGSWLAAWWNVHGPVRVEDDPIEVRVREVTRPYVEIDHRFTPYARDIAARHADLGRTGHFEVVEHQRFTWPWHHDGRSLRSLFASFSDFSTMREPDRTSVLDAVERLVDDEFGGSIERSYTTELYLARRLDS